MNTGIQAVAFTDDYSGFFHILLKQRVTTKTTEKFIADVPPSGKIKCIRSDNGTSHQNRTAERGWRTLFVPMHAIGEWSPKAIMDMLYRQQLKSATGATVSSQSRHLTVFSQEKNTYPI